MKQKIFSAGAILSVSAIIGGFLAKQQTYVGSDGVLHETLLTPISAFLMLIGISALFVSGMMYLMGYLQRR